MSRTLALLALSFALSPLAAQAVVVPNANATAAGSRPFLPGDEGRRLPAGGGVRGAHGGNDRLRIKALPPVPGVDEVLYPGEPEARKAAERRQADVPLSTPTHEALARVAGDIGVPPLPATG